MSYLDIDTILLENETVPCIINRFVLSPFSHIHSSSDIPHMGFLDPRSNDEDDHRTLRKGAKVDLPLWLAKSLEEGEDVCGCMLLCSHSTAAR
jgi:hypothetical protein